MTGPGAEGVGPEAGRAALAEANRLREAGRLAEAVFAYEALVAREPDAIEAWIALAAIHETLGDRERASEALRRGIGANPLVVQYGGGGDRPRALVLKGVEGSRFQLRKDHSVRLRGGNFSTLYLVDGRHAATSIYYVLGGNLARGHRVPECDLVINTVGDPDREMAALEAIESFAADRPDLPLINAPRAVRATTRDANSERLAGIEGLVFPRTRRLATTGREPMAVLEEIEGLDLGWPVLLRVTGSQTGRTFEMAGDRDDVMGFLAEHADAEIYVIEHVDASFTRPEEGDLRLYRKMRLFSIDGSFYPVVCHTDQVWNVHGSNRKTFMKARDWAMADEQAFLADPEGFVGAPAWRTLAEVQNRTGLDFFGIDFALLADGRVVIYETNAAMRHNFSHGKRFPYLMRSLIKVTAAFNVMLHGRIGRNYDPRPAGVAG